MDSRVAWAEKLIEARRYREAETILRDMSDPHAYQLMRKSRALRSGRIKKKAGAWDRRKVIVTAAVCSVVLAALVVMFAIIVQLVQVGRPSLILY